MEKRKVTMKGRELTVRGPELQVGQKAPDFRLVGNDLNPRPSQISAGSSS